MIRFIFPITFVQNIFEQRLIVFRIGKLLVFNGTDQRFLNVFLSEVGMLELLTYSDCATDPAIGTNFIVGNFCSGC